VPGRPWLRNVFLERGDEGPNARTHRARRGTTRLLLAAVARHPDRSPLEAFHHEICFGDLLHTDPAVTSLPEGPVWRGVMLRNYSVGAWRRLWAWTVNTVSELGATRQEIAEQFAAALPDWRLSDLVDSVPTSGDGRLSSDAEAEVRAESPALASETELRMLAIGARRRGDLEGPALEAFRHDGERVLRTGARHPRADVRRKVHTPRRRAADLHRELASILRDARHEDGTRR
jgi:hypothetical protein